MKNMKKLFSLALALVMMMALVVTAGAQSANTITIKDAYPGNTYTAYKILELDGVATGAQSYKIVNGWAEFFTTGYGAGTLKGLGEGKENDLTGYVSWTKDSSYDMVAFAKEALAFAKANNITAAGTASTSERTDTNYNVAEEITINVNGLGWYLVDTTNGSLCSLDVNTPAAVIEEKNEAPSIKKESDNTGDKQIGDTVNFTITVTAQKGAQKYVVHDTMGAGLTLNADSIAVTDLVKDTDYTVKTTGLTDGCTFEVVFTETYLDSITAPTQIVITYSAVINSDAVTQVIDNKAHLDYGDNNHTPESKVDPGDGKKATYVFDLVKTMENKTILPGAEFQLTRVVGGENETVKFSVNGNVYTVDPNGTVETITAGNVKIQGLGAVEYTLTETKAPEGYNELEAPVTVDLTDKADKLATVENNAWVSGGVHVVNYTGTELPSTGGIGTTIFTVTGALLMIGAAVLFLTKKRSEA